MRPPVKRLRHLSKITKRSSEVALNALIFAFSPSFSKELLNDSIVIEAIDVNRINLFGGTWKI